jgi:hypothetical protein
MGNRSTPLAIKQVLLTALDTAFDKLSWHGPNLMGTIRGVRAAEAAIAAIPGRKTIWDQVLHAAFWKQRVLNQATGISEKFPRRVRNWPGAITDVSERAWRADVRLLRDLQARLRAAVEALPTNRLDAKTAWRIQGAAAHDLYHAGQISLLRRIARGGRR